MESKKTVNPSSAKELYELLKLSSPEELADIDYTKLNYAIYARKSTSGDERQERSIPDQIKECDEKVVKPHKLNVIGKPIEEKRSAKDPDIRDEFTALLNSVRAGKIDGIISWHPDRLSRNMREAGEIIDLLDKGILKDLRFATFTFENSPTGKMLLGISFVLSKQYSEHLSESINRGNKSKIEAGIFFDEMKHGYVIAPDGKLFPDGENWRIIRQVFEKRLGNISQIEIAKWLNTTNYKIRKKGKSPTIYKWDNGAVSNVLRDPVYAGVLKYGKHVSNLEDFYDFTPIVTVEEFFKVNKVKDFGSPKLISSIMSNKREQTMADLLRGMVFCGYCHKPFTSGLTPKKLKQGKVWYYFYRCETELCEYRGKSVRAKVMLDYALGFLDTHLFTTPSNYAEFVKEAKEVTKGRRRALTSDIASLSKLVGNKSSEYERARQIILDNPDLKEHYNLKEISQELKKLKARLKELTEKRTLLKQSVITYERYLELFQNISVKLAKTHDMSVLDQLLKKFFLNFTIKDSGKAKKQRYKITHELKEPYAGFLKSHDFVSGGDTGTRTPDLLHAMQAL